MHFVVSNMLLSKTGDWPGCNIIILNETKHKAAPFPSSPLPLALRPQPGAGQGLPDFAS